MTSESNTLIRSTPCPQCGAMMLWTQNAWPTGNDLLTAAAYRCVNGHLIDPATTHQCPTCGVHDTHPMEGHEPARASFWCNRCRKSFQQLH